MIKPFTSSIRRHLLCWLLMPIVSLCVVGNLITYILAVGFATEAYDAAMLETAHSLHNRLYQDNSRLQVDLPPAAVAVLKHGDKDRFYFQVIGEGGKIISGDKYIPDPSPAERVSEEPLYYDGFIDGTEVRICALSVAVSGDATRHLTLKTAETTVGRTELIQSILLGVVAPQLVLILLAGLAVWFGVARGLMPLQILKEAVESRNPADLKLIDAGNVPKEVKPLVVALNNLLTRLQEDRDAQKRFVSNAAHQLRTPLAGLKTQTELALRYKDPEELRQSLKHISTSADRATRLAQQLLALARVEPSVFQNCELEAIDLNKIARDATRELVPQALSKEIDLGFEGGQSPQVIHGDAASLHELVTNLIDNAILYTQSSGKVTVRIRNTQKGPILVVEDNGPGIPVNERKQVFERFYRVLGGNTQGSGLGLAIVREIADAHNATVALNDGPDGIGTSVTVQFVELNFAPVQLTEMVIRS
jgi:two-component system, OmpR family, sensor histidine kinase TctE